MLNFLIANTTRPLIMRHCLNPMLFNTSMLGMFFLKVSIALLLLSSASCHSNVQKVQHNDLLAADEIILNARKSMQETIANSKLNTAIFPVGKKRKNQFLNREQRLVAWQLWQAFIEQLLLLDEIGEHYAKLYKNADKLNKQQAFRISYAAFLVRYRYTIEFVDFLEHYPAMDTLLNENVPELGLQQNQYKKIKFHYFNSLRATEFVRLNMVNQFYNKDMESSLLAEAMQEDIKFIWRAGRGIGTKQTLSNALKIVQDAGLTLWFPLQKEVSEWMGDAKIFRIKHSLISTQQIQQMHALLEPGDIILERREWYLSNIGLPGYWTHAALYIGTAEERKAYFNTGSLADNFLDSNMGFEDYLLKHYPDAYKNALLIAEDGHSSRVIEAISEGTSFTTLEHSIAADSVVILRPRLSKLNKAIAIKRAFHYSGRPYDFNFDFLTDSELVCTELIYKVYEPDSTYAGITFPLHPLVGRHVITANDIAEMFDHNYATQHQQLDFIVFYDGNEWEKRAVQSELLTFRSSWKRPKWYKWVQRHSQKPVL